MCIPYRQHLVLVNVFVAVLKAPNRKVIANLYSCYEPDEPDEEEAYEVKVLQ